MNKKVFVVFFMCIIFGIQGLFAQEEFTWHLALVKDNQGLPLENDKPVNMNNDEKFSIELYSEKDCYAYIVVEQASGSLVTLKSQYIKAGEMLTTRELYFKEPFHGQEKFYVVVSYEEQKSLQRAIDAYKNDQSFRNTIMLQTALSEIKEPRGDNPGKPSAFGGSIRGEDAATEYSGSSAYKKTIIISH